ncbi:D-aminoacyl-tRNA deacylase [Feifania hominis]|uniref:D-aminoacyl-tRNA deacylase n=1 Tax=Feifania hominis TaxID=2763660 RepID=A0A926HV97_9FIRM|nr:D-aminoacyl-tRNA deacylase [Feifania hominis]MBC8536765.1 D-tyrosyl-tRNA(Tyr) deacylase [Feifania hominis]
MRLVIQRVDYASVTVGGERISEIGAGYLVLLGIRVGDTEREADWLADKLASLRVFEDDAGKLNRSVRDIGGEILVVPNFTLYGDARHGNRPGFTDAARPEQAEPLYEYFIERLRQNGVRRVCGGKFRAEMKVALQNDGPITLVIDSPDR